MRRCAARGLASALLVVAALMADTGRDRSQQRLLTHEIYVWQLAWTPALRSALSRTRDSVDALHVLAIEIDPSGLLRRAAVEPQVLRDSRKPVIAVVRIDGRGELLPAVADEIRSVLDSWSRQRLPPTAVEIDFDCGTASLDRYAAFLRALRQVVPRGSRLIVTALPTWIGSPGLRSVTQAADEVVLQVHSIRNPTAGLFDAEEAERWIERFAAISPKPFKVALPAYGSRVAWDADGRVVAVDSEMRTRSAIGRELAVDPAVLAAFVERLQRSAVHGLSGIVWFRLPTDADQRAWSLDTFLAVRHARPIRQRIEARFSPRSATKDLLLENTGNVDAPAPREVRISARCRAADGVNGYRVLRDGGTLRWVSMVDRTMRTGSMLRIGWGECEHEDPVVEVVE